MRQNETADMLRQMARKFDQFTDQPTQPRDRGIGEVQAVLGEAPFLDRSLVAAPGGACETRRHILGKAERLADLTDGAFRAVMDDGGGDARAVARSEEHTSELQSLMRTSYAVFCLKKKKHTQYKH